MTEAATLLALAGRVEREGPSRELDGDIAHALALYPLGWRRGTEAASATAIWFNGQTGQFWSSPSVTGSFDAALALLPKGYSFAAGDLNDANFPWACVTSVEGEDYTCLEDAATPTLALVSAILRTRAAQAPAVAAGDGK